VIPWPNRRPGCGGERDPRRSRIPSATIAAPTAAVRTRPVKKQAPRELDRGDLLRETQVELHDVGSKPEDVTEIREAGTDVVDRKLLTAFS